MDDLFNKIVSCMDELSDAKGVARCGLMYALSQLIDAYRKTAIDRISELEKMLKEHETAEQ